MLNEEDVLMRFIKMVKADGVRRKQATTSMGGRGAGKKY
jgi:hypothetical protein